MLLEICVQKMHSGSVQDGFKAYDIKHVYIIKIDLLYNFKMSHSCIMINDVSMFVLFF